MNRQGGSNDAERHLACTRAGHISHLAHSMPLSSRVPHPVRNPVLGFRQGFSYPRSSVFHPWLVNKICGILANLLIPKGLISLIEPKINPARSVATPLQTPPGPVTNPVAHAPRRSVPAHRRHLPSSRSQSAFRNRPNFFNNLALITEFPGNPKVYDQARQRLS
jgi:hypothetical protein